MSVRILISGLILEKVFKKFKAHESILMVHYTAWLGNFSPHFLLFQHLQFEYFASALLHENQKVKSIGLSISTDNKLSMK